MYDLNVDKRNIKDTSSMKSDNNSKFDYLYEKFY